MPPRKRIIAINTIIITMNWYKLIKKSEQAIGYRVMTLDDQGNTLDGFPLQIGSIHNKPQGLYLSLDPRYVIENYSHGSEDPEDPQEVLGKYQFDPMQIIDGNLTDRETEFTVPSAVLLDVQYLHQTKN